MRIRNNGDLKQFLKEEQILGFFDNEIILKSGRKSRWYLNMRNIAEDSFLLDTLAGHTIDYCHNKRINPSSFYGVPEGATKLGVVLNYKAKNDTFKFPKTIVQKESLDEVAQDILESTKDLNPDCYIGYPTQSTALELAIVTQFKFAKRSNKFEKGSHDMPMFRSKPKEHGTPKDRFYVGEPKGNVVVIMDENCEEDISKKLPEGSTLAGIVYLGQININAKGKCPILVTHRLGFANYDPRLALIEDVTTTGGSLIHCAKELLDKKIKIISAIGIANRMALRDDGLSVEQAVHNLRIKYHSLLEAPELLSEMYHELQPGEEVKYSIEQEFEKYGVVQLKL